MLPIEMMGIGDTVRLHPAFLRKLKTTTIPRVLAWQRKLRSGHGEILWIKYDCRQRTAWAYVKWDGFDLPMINLCHLKLVPSVPETIQESQLVEVKDVAG